MTTKQSIFFLALPLLAACNNQTKEEEKISKTDTTHVVNVTDTKSVNQDSYKEQIMAQDTLLEDGSIPATWSDAGFDDPVAFKQFLVQFKEWVRTDNVNEITAHIKFPLKEVKTAEEFKKHYAEIFNQQLKDVVAKQRLDQIFRKDSGAMLGSGQIWFAQFDKQYLIIAINN